MKLVRPDYKQPPNIVKFIVSNEMTNHDIRNYLEKIYKVKVADVRSNIATGLYVNNYTQVFCSTLLLLNTD